MKYTFKKHGFEIIKKAVDPKIANFIYNYFLMKKQVAQTLFEHRYISPFTKDYGSWEDSQVLTLEFTNKEMNLKDTKIDLVVRYQPQ